MAESKIQSVAVSEKFEEIKLDAYGALEFAVDKDKGERVRISTSETGVPVIAQVGRNHTARLVVHGEVKLFVAADKPTELAIKST